MRAARSVSVVGLVVALGLSTISATAGLATSPAAAVPAAASRPNHDPSPVDPNPVRHQPTPEDPAGNSANLPDRFAEVPQGQGDAEATTEWSDVPGLPLRVRTPDDDVSGDPAAGAVPVSVSLEHSDQAGAGTLVLAVTSDPSSAAGGDSTSAPPGGGEDLDVEFAYSDYRYAFAGDWGSQLRVLAFPACFLTTPQVSRCAQGQEVASINDTDAETVTFTATVADTAADQVDPDQPADPSQPTDPAQPSDPADPVEPTASPSPSDTSDSEASSDAAAPSALPRPVPFAQQAAAAESQTVYVLASGTSGSGGDYGAEPLEPAAAWQVGDGSGNFTYSYPFELAAPAVGGKSPDLGLAYNSALVDGMNRARNGQASMAGMGWTLEPGYIMRSYARCSDDGVTGKSDLCWTTTSGDVVEELTIVLNGLSSKLIQVGTTNEFRVQDDPAWKVTRVYGNGDGEPSNVDNDNEAFKVRTPDGTEYWFGWGHGSGSTLTVPVYGNDAGEKCHAATVAASWCQQAWRWGLDRVTDSNGNRVNYDYGEEVNYYGRFGDSSRQTAYDANGYLTGIEYGYSRSGTSGAYSYVTVTTRPRCTKALTDATANCTGSDGPTQNPSIWPDVPTQFLCTATTSCTNYGPTFFSLKRYDAVLTRRWSGQTYSADRYQLTYTLPQPGPDGGEGIQDLWLESIQRTGQSGAAISMPEVNFDGVWLQNRVVDPTPGHPFNKLRVDSILTETGGRVDVRYGHADGRECTPANVSGVAEYASTRECYQQEFDGVAEWWHKYVVTKIGLSDDAMGYRLGDAPHAGPNLGRLRVFEYEYQGAPGWRYDFSPQRTAAEETWDDWRGYETVVIHTRKVGANQVPDSDGTDLSRRKVVVYRGLYGSRSNNSGGTNTNTVTTVEGGVQNDWGYLNGRIAEETLQDATGNPISRSYTDYNRYRTATNPRGLDAYHVYAAKTVTTPRIGGPSQTQRYTVDDGGTDSRGVRLGGLLESIDDRGTPGNTDDDLATCLTWDVDTASALRVLTKSWLRQTNCGSSGTVLGRTEVAYDGGAIGAVPTNGNPTLVVRYADGTTEVRTETTYDIYGRIKKQSQPYYAGDTPRWTTTTYNPGGDSHDLLTEVETTGPTVDADTPGFTTSTTLSAPRGLVTKERDANNQVTDINRDGLGRVTSVTAPGNSSGVPNVAYDYTVRQGAPSKIVTHTLRAVVGTSSVVDNTTAFYDGWGRSIETYLRNQRETGWVLSATGYDERGLAWLSVPTAYVTSIPANGTNPDPDQVAHTSESFFDAATRPTATWEKSMGAKVRGTQYTYTATSDEVSQTTPGGTKLTTTRTELDALGRTARIFQYGNGSAPDPTSEHSFDDGYAEYAYTPTGLLDTIKKPKSADPNDLITYDYDYDRLGRRTRATDPDTGSTDYTYDALSNPIKVDDASPNDTIGWVETSYDALGRPLLREQVKDNGDRATLGTWAYDASVRGLGRLTSTTSTTTLGEFTTSVPSYDQRGNPTATTYTYPGKLTGENLLGTSEKTYNYTYNQLGQPVSVDYPAAPHLEALTVTTSYGPYGTFDKMTTADGRTIGAASFDTIDRPTNLDSQATGLEEFGLRRSYTWDNRDRLTTLAGATGTSGSTAVTQLSLGYDYDTQGNPIRITGTRQDAAGDAPTTAAWCYSYDGINRLKSATTGLPNANTSGCDTATKAQVSPVTGDLYDLDYTYAQGRLATVTSGDQTITYSYGDPLHPHAATKLALSGGLLTPAAGLPAPSTLAYDTAGRVSKWTPAQVGRGATDYTYDAVGNLIKSDDKSALNAVDAKHAYDVNGIRVARESKGDTLYLGPMEISKANLVAAAQTRRYFTTPGGTPLAVQTSVNNGTAGTWTWLLADAQHNIRLSKADNAIAAVHHNYYPYGDPIPDATDLPGGRGYLDKTHDPNGDIRLDHRAYNPGLNILTTPDPLVDPGNPQSLNPYSYAGNNPVVGADPSGLQPPRCLNGCDRTSEGAQAEWYAQYAEAYEYDEEQAAPADAPAAPEIWCDHNGVCGSVAGFGPQSETDGPTYGESQRNVGLGFLASIGVLVCSVAPEGCAAGALEGIPGAEGTATAGGAGAAGGGGFLAWLFGRGERSAPGVERGPLALGPARPQWKINAENGALAEQRGFAQARSRGEVELRGLTGVNENGPDWITYAPRLGRIQVVDAKFSIRGKYPRGIPTATQEAWMPYVQDAVAKYSGSYASQVQRALVNGDIDWRIYRAP